MVTHLLRWIGSGLLYDGFIRSNISMPKAGLVQIPLTICFLSQQACDLDRDSLKTL